MTPRVATILSAREWESDFVSHARNAASPRLVLRAFIPDEVTAEANSIDVVVAGAETAWVTPARIRAWRRLGLRVVGIHPRGDEPARERLAAGGTDEILPDDSGAEVIARAVLLLEPASAAPTDHGEPGALCVVTGGRGAPGRTEIAVGLGWGWSGRARTVLVDCDVAAPGIAVRLGVPPRPDLADAVDAVLTSGTLPTEVIHRVGRLHLVVGSHRPGEPDLRPGLIEDVIDAARAAATVVVVDAGPWPQSERIVKQATTAALVAGASPTGIVRAARIAAEWSGPPPRLIVNRVRPDTAEMVDAARRWTGLEPSAVIPDRPAVDRRARRARAPHHRLLRALAPLRKIDR